MDIRLQENWTTRNNGYLLQDAEVARYNAVVPTQRQLLHAQKPFYAFIHFGMNTATGREWGNASETTADFNIQKIDAAQWVAAIKASSAAGIILTCKHHDGFCLWDTKATDFNVMHTALKTDIVKAVSDQCAKQGLDFGVYLSPWDMHEKTYATDAYNDYFCAQLTELLTGYGRIFEVWFDGAKGENAKAFEYDWDRYYALIRRLQPLANIAVCGPDIRWVGNEAGTCRSSEFSVVPRSLTMAETVQKHSQKAECDAYRLQQFRSTDEDLGSRKVLAQADALCWYPAEVDVSIRDGWFHPGGGNVKSPDRLFDIYLHSVGNNCSLLLNVPPNRNGLIDAEDTEALRGLGAKITAMTEYPILEVSPGRLQPSDGWLEFDFHGTHSLRYCILAEEIAQGQRVEAFDLYTRTADGTFIEAYSGTVIGSRKIIPLGQDAAGAILVIRQSRSCPILKSIAFYG